MAGRLRLRVVTPRREVLDREVDEVGVVYQVPQRASDGLVQALERPGGVEHLPVPPHPAPAPSSCTSTPCNPTSRTTSHRRTSTATRD